MNTSPARITVLIWLTYVLVGAVMGGLLRDLRLDDPFITYRFAMRLASGDGFNYNPNSTALITTAPLYALFLAVFAALGLDVPAASYGMGVLALVGGAGLLYHLSVRHHARWLGFTAGLLFLLSPLLWLTAGFEVLPLIVLALLAWWFVDSQRWWLAGGCAGSAIGLRGDGFVLSAVLIVAALSRACNSLDGGWRAAFRSARELIAGIVLTYAPLAVFLTAQFGSPIPTTLQTKTAQALAGLTGFYPGTSYLEGGALLAFAYWQQTPLFVFALALIVVGLWGVAWRVWRKGFGTPLLPLIAWPLLQWTGYAVLNVAPYVWYYAVPSLALIVLMAYGAEALRRVPRVGTALAVGGLVLGLLPLVHANFAIAHVLRGAVPPPPTELSSKVLPEAKVAIYEQVGRWIAQHTPPTATVGVTELGVLGYYSRRPMVDFLGLTQPERLSAIRRGDFIGGLLQSQPDYLALTALNAIYDANPQQEDWFRALYTPVATFDDPRFWGAPMTVWQRTQPAALPLVTLDAGVHDLGDGWQVTAVRASSREVLSTRPWVISVRLRAGTPMGYRELRLQPITVRRGDGLPVRSRLIRTDRFLPGEEAWYDFALLPPADAPQTAYDISIRWLDRDQPEVIAGRVKVPIKADPPDGVVWLPLVEGMAVTRLPEPLEACAGRPVTVTLHWRGGIASTDYSLRLEVRDTQGAILAAHESQPRNGTYPTTVWSPGEVIPDVHPLEVSAPPGMYVMVAGLVHPFGGPQPFADPSPARTADGNVRVGTLHLRACDALQSAP
ncbi:MAG: glycosyltransferase family 87 protein [Thermoflexales bacterium]